MNTIFNVNRTLLSLFLVGGLLTVSSMASATNGATGFTGKPNPADPAGKACSACHGGGGPVPAITGPATLAAGAEGDYSVTVSRTGSGFLAFAAAVCEVPCKTDGTGTKAGMTAGTNVTKPFADAEVVATRQAVSSRTYTFKIKAPPTGGTIRLYTVANATNGSGTGGDSAGAQTLDITVTGGTTPPKEDAGTTPPKTDGGTTPGGDDDDDTGGDDTGAGGDDTGTGSGDDTGTGSGDDTGAGNGNGGKLTPASKDDGGCSASPTSPEGASAILVGLGLVATSFLSRRKKRSA